MYTLRTVQKDGLTLNVSIGSSYRLVTKRTSNLFELHKKDNGFADTAPLSAIVYDGNDTMHPVWEEDQSFIMTESGKTFERI